MTSYSSIPQNDSGDCCIQNLSYVSGNRPNSLEAVPKPPGIGRVASHLHHHNETMIATVRSELTGEMVLLSPLQLSNIYRHFEWNNDPELNRLDSELPLQEESLGEFKKRFEELIFYPSGHSQDFELHTKDGGLIGVAEITGISDHNHHCSVSLSICDRKFWGTGHGKDAMTVLLNYCFGELKMHRVDASAFAYDDAWKRLVEGMGFRREGVERDYIFRDNRYFDKEIYALLESEYQAIRPTTNGINK